MWTVYVLRSVVSTRTYVGITVDLERRLAQHNGVLPGGARSTRASRPWTVAATFGPYGTRAEAQSVEYELKQRRSTERTRPLER